MTWIKICGMTTNEAVTSVLDAGADAAGFVFASSSRRLTPDAAAKLAAPARGRIQCVAVTRHPTQRELDEIIDVFQPDVLQTDAEDLTDLRLPKLLEVLPVIRSVSTEVAGGNPHLYGEQLAPARLLFDSAESGSGVTCDWTSARDIALRSQLILAGGLSPANVEAALEQVRPFGVDVSSGVEEHPGIKSPSRIARFVSIVRRQERR